ncbi:MAG: hypothetical protein ACHQUB_00710 [Candidatus Saccharimonadia bacterium]
MKCPNCGSTDIIAIQGQHYCINCGQQVTEPDAPKEKLTPPPDLVEAIKGTPLSLSVESLNKSDVPKAPEATLKVSDKPKITVTEPKLNPTPETKAQEIPVTKTKPVDQPVVLNTPEKPTPKTIDVSAPAKNSSETAQKLETIPSSQDEKKHTFELQSPEKSVFEDHPLRNAWHFLNLEFWFGIALFCLLCACLELVFRLNLSPIYKELATSQFRLSMLSATDLSTLMGAFVLALGAGWVIYLYRTFLSGEVIFRIAKELDGRPAGTKQARQVGLDSLLVLIALDAVSLIGLVLLGVLAIELTRSLEMLLSGGLAQTAVLSVCYFLLIYGGFCVILTRTLATRQLVITAKKFIYVYKSSFLMVAKNSGELVLWGIEVLAITLLFSLPIYLVGRVISQSNFNSSSSIATIIAVGIVATLSYYLVITFEYGFWTSVYHLFADRTQNPNRQLLMTGRVPKPNRRSLIIAIASVVIVAIFCGYGFTQRSNLASYYQPYIQSHL